MLVHDTPHVVINRLFRFLREFRDGTLAQLRDLVVEGLP